jgi:dTDP-4-dehydrorhamnose reductase
MNNSILVTGGKGQLASSIRAIADQYPTVNFIFVDRNELDITNAQHVLEYFKNSQIDWCINCAAYTAVDRAEEEIEKAQRVNVIGARNLAQASKIQNVKLVHISTDFVFDGLNDAPYKETDAANPQSIYGITKLNGENEIKRFCPSSFIIRTSWLYSEFGHNFMKTMLKLASERDSLSVVNDQIGTPTYAVDLAKAIMHIILENKSNYGVFHYANLGQITWFEFATTIFELTNINIILKPVSTKEYVTLAVRPKYSVLNTSKITEEFGLKIPFWKDSLIKALNEVKY